MHSIYMILSYCVWFWVSPSAFGENIDPDTQVGLRQYHQSCLFNRDCDTANNICCRNQCECIPNIIYDSLIQKCIVMKGDEIIQSCPDGYQCYGNICSPFCDMVSNDCKPAVDYKYYRNQTYQCDFCWLLHVALIVIIIALLVMLLYIFSSEVPDSVSDAPVYQNTW